MCMSMFSPSAPSMPPPPAPPPTPKVDAQGASVPDGYADTLTDKQKRMRAGREDDQSWSLLT